jgi:myosin tail region-interacting protein MTI1
MSDPAPPPKPKPGSLRDRIAAFEKKPEAPSPSHPLAPRPKPGGQQWKPRPRTPPESAASGGGAGTSTKESGIERRFGGGMSASDAKESISQGSSLKDRMAALQGKGAFGQPAPPPPKPSGDKPRWKPPPKPISLPQEENEGLASPPYEAPEFTKSPSIKPSEDDSVPKVSASSEDRAEGGDEEGGDEPDPEEEERQRRAAIAARMARLGGARVGMAPPVFGQKPSFKKPETPKDPETSFEQTKIIEPTSDGVFNF